MTEMHEDIQQMADVLGLSYDKTLEKLKENYDGYHFAWPSSDIFNPYSLLTCFSKRKVDSYWFGSGTPTYLLNMMRKYDFTPIDLGEQMDASKDDFDAATETMTTIMPLLYQSGYITIKNYDPETELYTLACLLYTSDCRDLKIRNTANSGLVPSTMQFIADRNGLAIQTILPMLHRATFGKLICLPSNRWCRMPRCVR